MLNNRNKRHDATNIRFDHEINGHNFAQQFDMLLNAVDVVSFDLFDTLVQRDGLFSPKDLFYQVEAEVERQLGLHLNDFTTVRIRAEEIARVRAWGGGKEETTLDEIYVELSRLLDLEAAVVQTLLEPAVVQTVLEIELDCERSALVALESGKRLFKAALEAGKTVAIISDTYFDEEFIIEIVNQHGYGDVGKVYTSSAYGKTKLQGSLYDIVLREFGCAPNKILHVGDNQLSDVTMALCKGIRALHLSTPKHWFKWRHKFGDIPSGNLVISGMLCNVSKQPEKKVASQDLQSVLTQTATQNLSFLYFAFSAWLVEQLKDCGYERVYFAARDGLIMKRFFDLTASTASFRIDSRYLYVSRAALYPILIFTEPETALRLFSNPYDLLTLEDTLARISLTYEECADSLKKHGLANRKLELNLSMGARISAFLRDVWPTIERNNEERFKLCVEYLRQEMVLTDEKAAFVDIGWHGSLQNSLLKLLDHLGISKDLRGFYLGTFEKPKGTAPNFRANGFLIENDEPRWISELVRSGPSVLELFHSAAHGSVLGYERNGTQVSPVLENNPAERGQFVRIIEPIQNLAFNFVTEQLKRISEVTVMSSNPELAARLALRVVYAPTAAQAKVFGLLKHACDFGGDLKSITGAIEWDLKKVSGETLPDGTLPIWRPGFQVLKNL